MHQKRLIQFVFAIQAAMGIGLAVLTLLLFQNQERLNRSRDVEFRSYLLADELRQSSDDLTRMARSYVATGTAEFERRYWTILDIRNGKIPRPMDYHRIYWDLILAPGQKPRPDGEAISLRDLMIREGFSDAEFQKLAEAQRNSDELVATETIAMNAVKGLFDDGAGRFTVKKEPDREMALRLMNDEAYHEKKFKIMQPIDEFFVMFGERTARDVGVREQRSQELLSGLLALIVATIGMFGLSFVALLRQVTRHKANREALRLSEERYRTLFDRANDGISLLSTDGRMVSVNESFARMHGYRAKEMLNMNLDDLDTPEFSRQAPERMRRLLAGEALTLEVEHYHKDGHVFPLEVSASLISLGGESFIQGLHRDITERKRAEHDLQASETRYRRLFESAKDGILILDAGTGQIVDVNPFLLGLLGFPQEYFLGKKFWEIGLFKDIAASETAFLELQKEKFIRYEDLPLETSDKRQIEVEFVSNVYLVDSAKVIQCNIRDITAHRRAEAEKDTIEDQLQQAQKMESVGRLAGGVAHDFNNMLGVILGHVELAIEQVDPAQPVHAGLEEIRKAAKRSADLTRQLLAFARKQTVAPKVLDLNETVAGMLKMLERLIGEDIDLEWHPARNLWPVKVDPSQIDQILANLCVNARDAIADVGKIAIETRNSILDEDYCAGHVGFMPGEYVRLSVSDNGSGMDQETLAHLFEPFFTTKGMGKGTGLGLATVYGTVKQNNGFINVYSEPKQGTTFTIYLPPYDGAAGRARMEAAQEPVLRGHETILLVEDEPAILKLATVLLERQGYVVLAASTPGEAIRLAKEYAGEIHLLMTDVIMPEMNGHDLAKNLLALYPQIKRLFMSGYTADVIAHHGVLDEGVYFIQKPFTLKDLAAKVREALESSAS